MEMLQVYFVFITIYGIQRTWRVGENRASHPKSLILDKPIGHLVDQYYLLKSVLLSVAKQLVTGHPFSINGDCPKPNPKSFMSKNEVKYKILLVELVTFSSDLSRFIFGTLIGTFKLLIYG